MLEQLETQAGMFGLGRCHKLSGSAVNHNDHVHVDLGARIYLESIIRQGNTNVWDSYVLFSPTSNNRALPPPVKLIISLKERR